MPKDLDYLISYLLPLPRCVVWSNSSPILRTSDPSDEPFVRPAYQLVDSSLARKIWPEQIRTRNWISKGDHSRRCTVIRMQYTRDKLPRTTHSRRCSLENLDEELEQAYSISGNEIQTHSTGPSCYEEHKRPCRSLCSGTGRGCFCGTEAPHCSKTLLST